MSVLVGRIGLRGIRGTRQCAYQLLRLQLEPKWNQLEARFDGEIARPHLTRWYGFAPQYDVSRGFGASFDHDRRPDPSALTRRRSSSKALRRCELFEHATSSGVTGLGAPQIPLQRLHIAHPIPRARPRTASPGGAAAGRATAAGVWEASTLASVAACCIG